MNTSRITRRTLLGASALATALIGLPAAAEARARPNIVVILVDDMGFSDIGSYGSEIPTPNLDALAAGGLRFTQFYNNARCSPSRAALLTGAYPHQAGQGHLEAIAVPGSKGLHGKLADRVVTIAEVLRPAGYLTAMAGKWHVGLERGVPPWERGFDRSFTSPIGELYYRNQPQKAAQTVYINGRETPAGSSEVGEGDWYSSDLFVDWSTRFFQEARGQTKPFLLYLPFVAPHFPVMAPPEEVARFKGKYRTSWEGLRRARLERQKELGIVSASEKLTPALPGSYDWDKLSADDQDRFDTMMAVYAASISRIDKSVGALVDRLRAAGELENTLILFMSDNGGNAESGPDGRLLGGEPGGPESRIFVGMNWAMLQNTPFSSFKHYTDEGGIATPLIVHWPRGVDARLNGALVREPGHLIDVMPTLVEVSGAAFPKTFKGQQIVPMQGRSMAPAFKGRPLRRDRPIFWEHEGNRAVRDGRWKLVAQFRKPWRLHDMWTDRVELHDLAASRPDLVSKMARQWDEWASASFVDPWQEAYDPYLDGKVRQTWGGSETPLRSHALVE